MVSCALSSESQMMCFVLCMLEVHLSTDNTAAGQHSSADRCNCTGIILGVPRLSVFCAKVTEIFRKKIRLNKLSTKTTFETQESKILVTK